MNTQNTAPTSPAERWGYASGMLLKRGYWRIKALESDLTERAQGAGVPAGQQLVRGGFLLAGLAVLGTVLFISIWLAAFILTMLAVTVYLLLRAFMGLDNDVGDPGPDYLGANSYLGNFDDNGHYIGHFKSSNDASN
jgi:hypothetical protein